MDVKKVQKKLFTFLKPVGKAYSFVMFVRAAFYKHHLFHSAKPHVPSISVGNISWGGSGKTPVSDWLLTWARERNLSPALLSRGYGGKPDHKVLLVKPTMQPEVTGDEPLMLARNHPEATVLVDPSRKRSLWWLKKTDFSKAGKVNPDILILDDAMQHLAVQRHINLVLLRAEDLLQEWDNVLPAGSWREGKNALKRASAILLRADPSVFPILAQAAEHRLKALNIPLFSFWLEGIGLRRVQPWAFGPDAVGASHGLPLLTPAHFPDFLSAGYVLCSGVGSPEGVSITAEKLLGCIPSYTYTYKDHQDYSLESFAKMCKHKLPILCTTKDAVKLARYTSIEGAPELYQIETELRFGSTLFTHKDFKEWLDEAWLEVKKSNGEKFKSL